MKIGDVSKTGLISYQYRQYLVADVDLYRKTVWIRADPADRMKVHVWYKDRYFGEASLYLRDNDYQKRQALLNELKTPAPLPPVKPAPLYSYLERKLAAHRKELADADLNRELADLRTKQADTKARLTPSPSPHEPFTEEAFAHLLSLLLRKQMSAHERLAIHTAWRTYGPFTEELVRKTTGELLGQSHPTGNLTGYLDALRIAALAANPENEVH